MFQRDALAGVARLIGTRPAQIQFALEKLAIAVEARKSRNLTTDIHPAIPASPYGDGHASTRIVDFLLDQPVREFIQAAQCPRKRLLLAARHATLGVCQAAVPQSVH